MFDPNIGRFTQPDPIGFESEDANLYRYVGNNPTNRIDPSGLKDPLQFGNWRLTDYEVSGPHKVGDYTINVFYSSGSRAQALVDGNWINVAPGIAITVDTPDEDCAKDIKFYQFHKFVVRVWGDAPIPPPGPWNYGGRGSWAGPVYWSGSFETAHGEHQFSDETEEFWYVDAPHDSNVPTYSPSGTDGSQAWMFDAPTSPQGAMAVAWKKLSKVPAFRIQASMYATTYIVVDGRPIFRVDWASHLVRTRHYTTQGKISEPKDSWFITVEDAKPVDNWREDPTSGMHHQALIDWMRSRTQRDH